MPNLTKKPLLSLVLVSCVLSSTPLPTFAWGTIGHCPVARLAQCNLSTRVRQEVGRLSQSGETLESIATWADVVRHPRPETKRWHYVDILPEHTNADPARDCKRTPFGDCIINALNGERAILSDPARLEVFRLVLENPQESRQARAEALKFLVHFIGDLHQPLHCADHHDQGGNGLKVTFFGASSNLHKVWDSDIIAKAGLNQTTNRVFALSGTDTSTMTQADSFVDWALEAHQLALEHAYRNIPANKRLGQPYFSANRPVVDGQLSKAGLRLASILNDPFRAP